MPPEHKQTISIIIYILQYGLVLSAFFMACRVIGIALSKGKKTTLFQVKATRKGTIFLSIVSILFAAIEAVALIDWTIDHGIESPDIVSDMLFLVPEIDGPIIAIIVLYYLSRGLVDDAG